MSRFDSFFGFSRPRPPHCTPMILAGKVILRCNDDYNATVTLMMMIMIIAILTVMMVMIRLMMIIIIITIGRLAIGLMMPSLVGELSLGGSSLIGHLDQEFHHHRNFVLVIIITIITITITIRGESEPGRLVLDNVNPSDAGIYKCRVDFRSLNL